MLKAEWIQKAKESEELLKRLIGSFHPSSRSTGAVVRANLPITAMNAEVACEVVRLRIRELNFDPVAAFVGALVSGDVNTAMEMLDSTWFGVPESTACWRIPGFKEAVELLEDPPEEDLSHSEVTKDEPSEAPTPAFKRKVGN